MDALLKVLDLAGQIADESLVEKSEVGEEIVTNNEWRSRSKCPENLLELKLYSLEFILGLLTVLVVEPFRLNVRKVTTN